ncbi:hybrid sensor histidine kinase/response regulator [Herpetosiphon llansteffanensis]|uniref:hybrid sensor histidine kinase/response regulator n=1 Tax=Herpetosiphon llansteffanensis TaxID=2094568 RepID=UPI000D7BE061|nr:HAMP domain-containing sensor histidine kinase [Herpetosiphon llansteffanensis]
MDLHHVRILLLDQTGVTTRSIAELISAIQAVRYQLIVAVALPQALTILTTQRIDVVIVALTAQTSELNWIQTIREQAPIYPVIVFAETIDEPIALHALHTGAHDYVLNDDLTPSVFQRTIRYARAMVAQGLAEQQVQALTFALATAMSAAQQVEQQLDVAIHEIQTPMTILLGYIQLFERRVASWGGIPLRERKMLNTMRLQAIHISRLVKTLLDTNQMATNYGQLQRRPLELGAVLRAVVASIQGMRASHLLVLRLPESAVWIDGDYGRLMQIFHNLLLNALKYSDIHSEITLTLLANGQISVRDYGIGIPDNALPKIFNPFFRAQNAQSQLGTGDGIGLAVVQDLVHQHEGSISVSSEVDSGTTMTLQFPCTVRPNRLIELPALIDQLDEVLQRG